MLLHEITALLDNHDHVCLPFPSSGTLANHLDGMGYHVHLGEGRMSPVIPSGCTALYFGTPTIVDNKALFPEDGMGHPWTKEAERQCVRRMVNEAETNGYRRIISGLGSGDISPEERLEDMGPGARIVCVKYFDDFTDWVMVRDL